SAAKRREAGGRGDLSRMPRTIPADNDDNHGSIDGYITNRAGLWRRSGIEKGSWHIRSRRPFLLSNRDALPHSCRLHLPGECTALEERVARPKEGCRFWRGVRQIHVVNG